MISTRESHRIFLYKLSLEQTQEQYLPRGAKDHLVFPRKDDMLQYCCEHHLLQDIILSPCTLRKLTLGLPVQSNPLPVSGHLLHLKPIYFQRHNPTHCQCQVIASQSITPLSNRERKQEFYQAIIARWMTMMQNMATGARVTVNPEVVQRNVWRLGLKH